MQIRFYLEKLPDRDDVPIASLMGFVRGLEKCTTVKFRGSIEYDSSNFGNKTYPYVIEVTIPRKFFELVKAQAESYVRVKVVKVDKFGGDEICGER